MATSARIAVIGDIVSSLSLSLISFYVNSETLAPCEITVFFFFLGNENLGFLKHNDWNLREDTKALQFLQVSLSRSLFTLKNVFISFCNLLSFFFIVEIKPT